MGEAQLSPSKLAHNAVEMVEASDHFHILH